MPLNIGLKRKNGIQIDVSHVFLLQSNLVLYFAWSDHRYLAMERYLTDDFVSFVRRVSENEQR